MHLWTYLVLRSGGGEALSKMIETGDWNTDACINAGKAVEALNALDPYQKGYASAVYNDEAAAVGNGKAAMELMGQWAPSVQKDQSANKTGLGDKLGWFAFPTLAGGAGAATDGVGGGNGIAVGKNAPPEAIDFLKFFMDKTNQDKLNTDGVGLATTVGTESTVTDPNLQAVLAGRGAATFMQLYLDQATTGNLAATFNDATWRCSLASPPPRRRARPSPTRLPRSRASPREWNTRRLGSRADRLSRPAHSVGGRQGRVASRRPGDPLGSAAAREVADDRPLPAARARALSRLRHRPDHPGRAIQPVQVERPRPAGRTSSGSRTTRWP